MNRKFLARRVGQAALTVWAVVTISFGMIRLMPGDAQDLLRAQMAASGSGNVDMSTIQEAYDIEISNAPLWQQYLDYWAALFRGDFGYSTFYKEPVAGILAQSVPWTLFYVTIALALTFAIGISIGAFIAYKEGSRLDVAVSSIATFLNSVPYYVAAILFVWILGYNFSIFPVKGRKTPGVEAGLTPEFIGGALSHAALPILSIVVTAFGFRALAMRGNSIQVLGEDYVRVADLRGLSDRRIALQYVGRNAVLPLYTSLMIAVGITLGASVIIEYIFQYKGLGYFFIHALNARDYPLMMGAFLIIAISVAVGLFIADLTYGFIDPRAGTEGQDDGSSGSRSSVRARILAFVAMTRRFQRSVRARVNGTTVREPVRQTQEQRRSPDVEDSLFHTTADVVPSRRERLYRTYLEYVVAPAKIIWQDTRARVGLAIISLYVLMGTVGVMIVPGPRANQAPRYLGAFQDWSHPLGADVIGKDVLSTTVHATGPMLQMMLAGAVFATVVATTIGIFSGYMRGRIDQALMQVSDIVLTIPGLPLVLVLAVLFEPKEPWAIGLLLAVNAWGGTARQIRAQVLATGREAYVEASGIMSLSVPNIMVKDILPNIAPFVFIRFVQIGRQIIIAAVALYFLGVLSLSSTTANWGVMIRRAYDQGGLYSFDLIHWILPPIVAIVLLVYGLILFAQGTDRVFNPRVRARHIDTDSSDEGTSAPTGAALGDD